MKKYFFKVETIWKTTKCLVNMWRNYWKAIFDSRGTTKFVANIIDEEEQLLRSQFQFDSSMTIFSISFLPKFADSVRNQSHPQISYINQHITKFLHRDILAAISCFFLIIMIIDERYNNGGVLCYRSACQWNNNNEKFQQSQQRKRDRESLYPLKS